MSELISFTINIAAALIMGVVIGLERQWRQHTAGLRTNALVALGAAMFVSLSRLMDDTGSPTRIASYIVSGLGFLGGGVILRDGLNVKGMNTAATIWCTGAVGTLAGSGFILHGLVGTVAVLAAHLLLRPVVRKLESRTRMAVDVETLYRMRVVCLTQQEAVIRMIFMRHVNSQSQMALQGLLAKEADLEGNTAVVAEIFSSERNDRYMNELVSRIGVEPGVSSVSWEMA